MNYTLSLIIPCYNEENTIEKCVGKVLELNNRDFALEIVIVNDCSTDKSAEKLLEISQKHPEIKIYTHEKNRGKGAALKTGLIFATGDYIGIQDADDEYNPMEYIEMLKPLVENKADVVYGSRYLRPDTRRVLYFWHTWMNKTLTSVSNMFTNMDITDMETCYKLFRREIIQKIAPDLKEERFGFEPEITAKVAQENCRVYECAISYNPRTYEEGKKIGWKDGIHALYCIFHYSAHTAPLPMQILIYLFIGAVSLFVNFFMFIGLTRAGIFLDYAIIISFGTSALCNYLLCIAILFRHNVRWNTFLELFWYLFTVVLMGILDFVVTRVLISIVPFFMLHWSGAKFLSSLIGFIGNFVLRKTLVFPEKGIKRK
jgi:glycosyltransferase involved in cell wall biosynthesis